MNTQERKSRLTVPAAVFWLLIMPTMLWAALPMSRSTTYVAGSPPAIKAQDLNDLQDYLGRLFSGTRSVVSVTADGTGNAATAPAAGTVNASQYVQVGGSVGAYSATPPFAMTSAPWGQLNKEQVLLGAAHCVSAAGVVSECGGFNVKSASGLGGGEYEVQFNTSGSDFRRHSAVITPIHGSAMTVVVTLSNIVSGAYRVRFLFYNAAGAPTEPAGGFMIQATGG